MAGKDENGQLYKVTGQRPDFAQGDGIGAVQGVTITFTTVSGHQGQVFVPDSQYTEEGAGALLRQKAAALEAVGKLTS